MDSVSIDKHGIYCRLFTENIYMRLIFINPPMAVTEQIYTKRVAKQYTSSAYVLPNTSIAYLAAYMEKVGYEVRIIDAFALGLSMDETAEQIRRFDPFAVCYSLCTQNFLNTLSWIKGIKERTGILTIVGGLQMSIYPREVLTYPEIDYGVIGDGWETMPELLQCVAEQGDLSTIRGICYREDGEYRETPERPVKFTLEDVPYMARHLLPNDRYTTVMTQEWPITIMLSALGCPLRCAYCDVPTGRYQARLPEHVVDEIDECVNRYGIREILFQDETFTLNRSRVLETCELIRSRGLKFHWSIRARVDYVDREILHAMKEAGLTKINFGIESGNPEILKKMNRDIPLDVVRQAICWTKEEGLTTLGFFIIGFPGETEADVKETIKFALELDCDFIQVNKMVPQPPSPVYRELVERTGIDYWREYTLGNAGILGALPGIGSSFDPESLDIWQRRFFRKYYYRPSYILKRLKKISSFKEMKGLARAALSIR